MEDNFAFVCQSASIKSWIFFFYHPHFNIFIYFISFIPRLVFKSAAFDCLNCVAVPMGLLGELLQLLLHILIKNELKILPSFFRCGSKIGEPSGVGRRSWR